MCTGGSSCVGGLCTCPPSRPSVVTGFCSPASAAVGPYTRSRASQDPRYPAYPQRDPYDPYGRRPAYPRRPAYDPYERTPEPYWRRSP